LFLRTRHHSSAWFNVDIGSIIAFGINKARKLRSQIAQLQVTIEAIRCRRILAIEAYETKR
jgi:hypothetical protein